MVTEEIREYNKQLITKYPWLLPRNVWTDEIVKDYDYSYTLLDDMPDGWRAAFGEQMCAEIKQALLDAGGEKLLDEYRVDQIKEKYGYLRWYDNFSTERTRAIVDKYEVISSRTCIKCGKPATKLSRGWIAPWCDECGNGKDEEYMSLDNAFI